LPAGDLVYLFPESPMRTQHDPAIFIRGRRRKEKEIAD
jgi:hypothetical protein